MSPRVLFISNKKRDDSVTTEVNEKLSVPFYLKSQLTYQMQDNLI